MAVPRWVDVAVCCPEKTKTRGYQARVRAETPMPIDTFKVNFSGQVPDLTHALGIGVGDGVFPGENRKRLLIPDSSGV
jgi:hypothetical protein